MPVAEPSRRSDCPPETVHRPVGQAFLRTDHQRRLFEGVSAPIGEVIFVVTGFCPRRCPCMIGSVTQATRAREALASTAGRTPRRVPGASRAWVVPQDNPIIVLEYGWSLLAREGPRGLLRGIGRFMSAASQFIYSDKYVRFYHLPIDRAVSVHVSPPSEDPHLHIVESREDILELVRLGYENPLEIVPGMQRRLTGGAVAACAFVGQEFASIDWMALSNRAKGFVDSRPYPSRLTDGEACAGGSFTVRRFRRRGVSAYRWSAQVEYLHARGCRVCHSTIPVDNIASQRTAERYGATFDIVFRHRRILGRNKYETVLPSGQHQGES